jgi:bifunctional DNase/RNase
VAEDRGYKAVTIDGIVRDQNGNPVVLLKAEDDGNVLPIWVGHAEGMALEMELKGDAFERPLTHDLLKTTILSLGGSIAKVAITELRNNTFFAKIYIQRESEIYVIDARPSDAMILAVKSKSQIFVANDVFANHQRLIQSDKLNGKDADDQLRRYLEDLDPGEF